jgi:Zn-finger nucleic acid-binding protein
MIVLEVEGVEIDHCLSCGGVWLDGGELELLLEGASNRDELMASLTPVVAKREKKIRCPMCSKKLGKVAYGPAGEIILDKCPRHHGLWFDRDELARALEMGHFEGKPVYDVLTAVFGGAGRQGPTE